MKPTIPLLLLTTLPGPAQSSSTRASCKNYTIPLTITSANQAFNLPIFRTNFDVADFIDTISSRNTSTAASVVSTTRHNVTASYKISATFCQPAGANPRNIKPNGNTVLIATHGLNFDRSYWDPDLDKARYSFVDWAVGRGYSVLYYDRLGVGLSSRVSGYVAQLENQVAILAEIARLVRAGRYVGDLGKPGAVVLVGHSFGSALSVNTVSQYPDLADGVVLTGFSLNETYNNLLGFIEGVGLRIAAGQDGEKWGGLDSGYLTPVDIYSNVASFFKAPDYSQAVARYADANKSPFAVGELVAARGITGPPYAFKGVVMIITGQFDYIFCKSDCDGALEIPAAQNFKNARAFKTVSYLGAGHGLNLHLNAAGSFKQITDFLEGNGL